MALRIRVLGATGAELDGDEVDLAGPRPAQLLALLAAAEGRAVDAGALADQLWLGRPPATAGTTLQGHVARLRRRLEPGAGARDAAVVRTVGTGYALRLPRSHVDAHRFEDLVHAGHAAAEQGRAEDAARLLGEALTLWRPRPYADVAEVDEVVPVVARLEELRLGSAERLAALRLDAGDAAAAAADLAALVTEQPLRESTSALLARALYRCGRQADALEVLRRLRARLDEELGLDPTPRLQALEQAVLRHDPSLDPVAGPAPAVPALTAAPAQTAPTTAPTVPMTAVAADGFVGRREELAAVAAALGRVQRQDVGGVVVVTGEPGIGKTRLVEAAVARTGARARWGRCTDVGGAPAWWPWLQVLGTVPDAGSGFAVGLAVAHELAALAGDHPLLVVLDDVQWADADSRQALEVVLSRPLPRGVLLVLLCREEATADPDTARLLALAARAPGSVRLHLAGLGTSEVVELASQVTGRPADPAAAAVLADRSGGNPFFVGELAVLGDGGATGVPPSVRDVLRLRLGGLDAEAAAVLAVAAVQGRGTTPATAAEVLERTVLALTGPVEAALRSGLLVEPRPGTLAPAHDLVREVVLDTLGPVRRADLHRRLADVLQRSSPVPVAALAVHRSEAAAGGTDEAAALACLQAAEDALAGAAAGEAVRLAERGLPHSATDATATALHLVRAAGLRRLGLVEDGDRAVRAAAALAREAGDDHALARAALVSAGGGVGGYWATSGAPGATDTVLLEEAVGRAAGLPAALRAQLHAALAVQRATVGRDGVALADLAAEEASGDPVADVRAAVAGIVARWSPRHAEDRVRRSRALLERASRADGDPTAVATALHLLRCALLETGREHESAAVSRRYGELAGRRGDGDLLLLDLWWRAGLALAQGRWDEARAAADEAVASAPAASPAAADTTRMSRQTVEGIVAWHEHRLPEVVPTVVDLAETVDPDWLGVLAQAHAQAGRREAALEAVDALLRHPGEGVREAVRTVLLADVYLELEDADRARGLLPALEACGDTVVVLWAGTTVLGPAALYRGGVLRLLGDDRARAELERAVELGERSGLAPFVTRARRWLADLSSP